ncbi:DUF6236 family protein [Serinicoccus sediminis]|uniref:DUF6236 family protein n=1 Tax=Serinicoccus sediminis TaxID=2306021 RepID=UPI00102264BC|nr:DUF6236 family protein [Serinicoccus sediminis]
MPHDYPTKDSRTAKVLQNDLGFLNNRRPGQSAVETSRLFLDFLNARDGDVQRRLGVQPSLMRLQHGHERPRDGGLTDDGTIGYIFAEKLAPELIDALANAGLAFGASSEQAHHRRLSMNVGSASWIGMDSRLAAAYMTVLTRLTAQHFDLRPVTDVARAHVAMDAPSVEDVSDLLLGHAPLPTVDARDNLHQRVALLAVESSLPRALSLVPTEAIVQFRKHNEELLGDFQAAVHDAVTDLQNLPADVDEEVLRERLIEVTQDRLLKPRDRLRKSLGLFNLDPVDHTLGVQVPLGVTVAGTANLVMQPVQAVTAGAAAGVFSYAIGQGVRRRQLRKVNSAGNYLMKLSKLKPTSVVRKSGSLWHR